jgi:predicted PurR-regulated permease PerM
MNETNRPHWLPRTKLTVILLLLGFFVYLLTRFSVVIAPFILACVLAYVISPVVNFLEHRGHMPRTLATTLVYLILIAAMITLPAVLIPAFGEQIAGLNLDIQLILQQAEDWFGHQYVFAGYVFDGGAIFNEIVSLVQNLLQPLFGETLGFAVNVLESLVWVIFILVVSFYLVKDGSSLRTWAEKLPPPELKDDFIKLREEVNSIWAAFFRGQILLAAIVATIFTVIGLAIGLPSPFAMGVFAGLMEFFPSVGHGIWLTTASLIAVVAGSTWIDVPNWVFAVIIIGLHLVFQQFDLNYLIPRVIGRQVHLPPLVVILGIVAGAAVAGVLGVALAAPTIASARVIGRYVYANLFDTDPFPVVAATQLPPPDPRWWAVHRDRKSAAKKEQVKDNPE